ncbi:MAG: DUF3240 family protein [Gammaproteobacteria bacterium]|nr:DUF3240 family protein [Gammaproteobacteria bacterium]
MKLLTLIVHAGIEQSLGDMLRGLAAISGFTFTPVQGHGSRQECDPVLSARDSVVGYTPHIRVDIVLQDNAVPAVLSALRQDQSLAGRGVYWLTLLEESGRL